MAETETYVRLIQMIKSVLKLLVLNCSYTIPGSACTSWHVFAVLSLETCLMQGSNSISVIVHIVHHYQKKQKERSLLTNGATQSYEERGAKSVGCKLCCKRRIAKKAILTYTVIVTIALDHTQKVVRQKWESC